MKSEKKKSGSRSLSTRRSLLDTSAPLIGHEEVIARFAGAVARAELAHAYLLTGRQGAGRRPVAESFAGLLFCRDGKARAAKGLAGGCGACPSCAQFAAGAIADFLRIEPPEGKREIPIAAIREPKGESPYPISVDRFFSLTSAAGGARVVILDPADLLTSGAANALLKILEEPPAGALFLLIADADTSVLPTLRSRCQILRLKPVGAKELSAWLVEHHGATRERADFLAGFSAGAPGLAARLSVEKEFADLAQAASLFAGGIGRKPMAFASGLLAWAESGGKKKTREDERVRLRQTLDLVLYALEPKNALAGVPELAALAASAPSGDPSRQRWRGAVLQALSDLDANVYLPLVVAALALALGSAGDGCPYATNPGAK